MALRIVAISDTHMKMNKITLPEGDVLVHAGDLTFDGSIRQISQELKALKEKAANFSNILLICGNHDWLGERNPDLMRQLCIDNGITYLHDSSIVIDGVKYYGSPWTPEFHGWAFNLPRGQALADKWALIPEDTDVLITHGPPRRFLDTVLRYDARIAEWKGEHVGCADLEKRVLEVTPKLHIFGHIHEHYGEFPGARTRFVNASVCNDFYKPVNPPIVLEINAPGDKE